MKNISKIALEKKYEEIRKLYLSDNRPWIIGYSGGKDSTATLQMICNALKELDSQKRTKKIYVVSSDTMIENPLILEYIRKNIDSINSFSQKYNLPMKAQLVRPNVKDTFWTLLIGKGYPTPRQKFRWCTSRLKIKPIDEYINQITEKYDEVIVVLGVRSEESQSRSESIKKRTVEGKILKIHATNNKAYVYAPIEHFDSEEIWFYLMNDDNPWGNNNRELLNLYNSASDPADCIIQQDKDAPSCGHSRFGCWVCTVVSKDKSLTGFIENGYKALRPLLKFRNELVEMREQEQYRQKWRMNGSFYYIVKNGEKRRGFGPFTLEARKRILKLLFEAEKEFNELIASSQKKEKGFYLDDSVYHKLITDDELLEIRTLWLENGDWENSLHKIAKEYGRSKIFDIKPHSPIFGKNDREKLEKICKEN